jgi:hypothetical protein
VGPTPYEGVLYICCRGDVQLSLFLHEYPFFWTTENKCIEFEDVNEKKKLPLKTPLPLKKNGLLWGR